MCISKKYIALLFCSTLLLEGSEFVTITTPANSSTVTGLPLSITGTASQANTRVQLTVNTTEVGTAITDGSGNWNFSVQGLQNGNYTITAKLVSSVFETLATAINAFTVQNPETITIISPIEDQTVIFVASSTAVGQASLASTAVQFFVDNVLVASTTTDTSGNWEVPYAITTNGAHTLLAKLIVSGNPVATASVNIEALVPVIFPSGISQIRIVDGNIPTSGSGSGPGYTYIISGSTAIISFVPAFSVTPSVVATGQRPSGSSTITISAVSIASASMGFSNGTQRIHFTAIALS